MGLLQEQGTTAELSPSWKKESFLCFELRKSCAWRADMVDKKDKSVQAISLGFPSTS